MQQVCARSGAVAHQGTWTMSALLKNPGGRPFSASGVIKMDVNAKKLLPLVKTEKKPGQGPVVILR